MLFQFSSGLQFIRDPGARGSSGSLRMNGTDESNGVPTDDWEPYGAYPVHLTLSACHGGNRTCSGETVQVRLPYLQFLNVTLRFKQFLRRTVDLYGWSAGGFKMRWYRVDGLRPASSRQHQESSLSPCPDGETWYLFNTSQQRLFEGRPKQIPAKLWIDMW
jgi:hypothetical protein